MLFDLLFVFGASGDDPGADAVIGAAGAVLGGPAIHLAHRHYGKAALSGALRLAGAGLSLAIAVDCCEDNPSPGKVLRLIAPLIIAQAIDIAAIARETVRRRAASAWGPAPVPARGGLMLVWSGHL